MTTTALSPLSSSALSPVKVNVRLCGSVPRQEMEALSLTKCAPLMLRSPNTSNSNTNTYMRKPQPKVVEDETDVALQLCSQLCSMSQQPQTQPKRAAPTFEAPSWAVPANGESRLEVSFHQSEPLILYAHTTLSNALFFFYSLSVNLWVDNRP